MKKRMTNLFASLFLILAVGLAVVPWMGIRAEAVKKAEEDQICDTWQEIEKDCCGDPTNCFCEIIVTP